MVLLRPVARCRAIKLHELPRMKRYQRQSIDICAWLVLLGERGQYKRSKLHWLLVKKICTCLDTCTGDPSALRPSDKGTHDFLDEFEEYMNCPFDGVVRIS